MPLGRAATRRAEDLKPKKMAVTQGISEVRGT
jgi:hypothetical protein